jgi:hypothetical protein
MRLILLFLMVSASCATAKPECMPQLSKACDPTQLEHWEEEMRLALAELKEEGVDDAEEYKNP